jgi:hypothetical protein
MADDETGSTVSDGGHSTVGSTTWVSEQRKIRPAPQAKEHRASAASTLRGLLPWPRRKPLTLTLTFRGGSACWYEIRGRGRTIRRPGVIALHDLMREFYRDDRW